MRLNKRLMFPFRSSVFRGAIARSQCIFQRAPVVAETLAISQALNDERLAWQAGTCK
jgi:hypothetical protein